jgi:hypothetical protein
MGSTPHLEVGPQVQNLLGYDRGTRQQGESRSQMEESQAEDRHNPLPHIALSTTAPKSAYKNTASLSARTATELQELHDPGRPGMVVPRLLFFVCGRDGIA